MKNFMKRHKVHIVVLLILLLLYIFVSIWISVDWIVIREYEYAPNKSDRTQEVTIAILSDLHDHEFGTENKRLIDKIKEQEPDLILLDGDFLNKDSADAKVPCEVIRGIKEIAPVYYALGNHEIMYMKNGHPELIRELESAGAVVLDKVYIDLDIGGQALRLGGMYDYAFGLDGGNRASAAPQDTKDFLEDFQNTERVKIMMAHRPDSFIFGDASSYWDVDLVVSGHDHGGQVVLPVFGGLYGGDQGWFPQYIHGLYHKDQMQIFITSGLGTDRKILPRFNNPPEIAVLTLNG